MKERRGRRACRGRATKERSRPARAEDERRRADTCVAAALAVRVLALRRAARPSACVIRMPLPVDAKDANP